MLFISYGDRKNPRKDEEWMNHESEELNKIVDALVTEGLADLLELSFVGCFKNVVIDFFIK